MEVSEDGGSKEIVELPCWKIFNSKPTYFTDLSCNLGHYQLANQMCSAQHSSKLDILPSQYLFYVDQFIIKKLNHFTKEVTIEMELRFIPQNIHCSYDHLVVAGPTGELIIKDLKSEKVVFNQVTSNDHSINNSAIICKSYDGSIKVFVSSNDETVKIFSLNNLSFPPTILQFQDPINAVCVSHDGTSLVAVGDSPQITFWSSVEGNRTVKTSDNRNHGFFLL